MSTLVNEHHANHTGRTGITTVEPSLLTTCIPLGNYSAFAPTSGTNATTSADTLAGGFESTAGYAAYSTALSVTIAIGCSLLILNVTGTTKSFKNSPFYFLHSYSILIVFLCTFEICLQVLIFAGVYYQRDKTRLEVKSLQKQYQQRGGLLHHQQAPFDPIKHAHYHMGHSQSANVIVDVENHHHDNSGGTLLLTASGDIKSSHICSNAMQIGNSGNSGGGGAGGGGGTNVCQQTKLPLGDAASMTSNAYNNGRSGGGGGNNVVASNNVVSAGNICQVQGMQGMNEHCVQTIPIKNRNNTNSYNAIGMMTLPKGGQQQPQHLSASINYGGSVRGDCATLPRNINSANAITGVNLGNFIMFFHLPSSILIFLRFFF